MAGDVGKKIDFDEPSRTIVMPASKAEAFIRDNTTAEDVIQGTAVRNAEKLAQAMIESIAKTPEPGSEFTCNFCPRTFVAPEGFKNHLTKDHTRSIEVITKWSNQGRQVPVRQHASNRNIIAQAEKWGWRPKDKKNEQVLMELNECTIWLAEPGKVTRNSSSIMVALYDLTNVSGEQFWDGPIPSPDPELERMLHNEEELEKRIQVEQVRGHSTRLLELMIAQDNPITEAWMAMTTGFNVRQVNSAMNYMKGLEPPLVRKIKQGMWESVERRQVRVEVDQTDTVTETVTAIPAALPEAELPIIDIVPPTANADVVEASASYVSEEEIFDVLDMLVPQGFKGRHFPTVNNWVQATRQLVKMLREDR